MTDMLSNLFPAGLRYYYLEGREVRPVESVEDFYKLNMHHVGDTCIHGEGVALRVSTVFLVLDHNHWGGPPILFETMIFGGKFDQNMTRYCTYDEAEAGHAAICAEALRRYPGTIAMHSYPEGITYDGGVPALAGPADTPEHVCKYCGRPSHRAPEDQTAPADYCQEDDHE